MKQIIYLGGKKAREYSAPYIPETEEDANIAAYESMYELPPPSKPPADVIGDCDWKEGEVKTEGVDYGVQLQAKNDYGEWYNTDTSDSLVKCLNTETRTVIVPIPKKQEGESAATPPDVEQMAEYLSKRIAELNEADASFCKDRWDENKPKWHRQLAREQSNAVTLARQELENVLKKLEAGQSAVQDATPQEDRANYRIIMDLIQGVLIGANGHARGATEIYKEIIDPLFSQLSALRSELSAAQEENKRLRELFESEDVAQQRMRENGD